MNDDETNGNDDIYESRVLMTMMGVLMTTTMMTMMMTVPGSKWPAGSCSATQLNGKVKIAKLTNFAQYCHRTEDATPAISAI